MHDILTAKRMLHFRFAFHAAKYTSFHSYLLLRGA
jgi:hypothetical protein